MTSSEDLKCTYRCVFKLSKLWVFFYSLGQLNTVMKSVQELKQDTERIEAIARRQEQSNALMMKMLRQILQSNRTVDINRQQLVQPTTTATSSNYWILLRKIS
jgi:hypothetical protein